MNPAAPSRYHPRWLALREPADAAARSRELLEPLRDRLAGTGRLLVHDLGCGTGAMGRWLAGRLPGRQHWLLYDHDPELLGYAAAHLPGAAADGAPVTGQSRHRDLTTLTTADLTAGPAGADLAGADPAGTDRAGAGPAAARLVTGSALLDLLTRAEVDRLAAACAGAACPALLTLSVVGQVDLSPADPLDPELAAGFNAHQRRDTGGRRLLGPDAPGAAAEAFARHGAEVQLRPSPWRLGPDQSALAGQWLRGWVAAACEQRPELAPPAAGYLHRRLAAATAGELRVTVGHQDLLALPG